MKQATGHGSEVPSRVRMFGCDRLELDRQRLLGVLRGDDGRNILTLGMWEYGQGCLIYATSHQKSLRRQVN